MKKKHLLTDRETFHLEIPADENNLSKVRDFISNICVRAGFSRRETNNTKLAVDEACTNIIKHAYHERGGNIRIDIQAERGKVEINIFDRGEPFDWSKIKDPDLDEYVEMGRKGGLGIFLMSRLMDSLDYQSSDAGNRLFMSKGTAKGEVGAHRLLFMPTKPTWTSTLRFKFGFRAALGFLALVIFIWAVMYVRQSQTIEVQRAQAWGQKRVIAENLASKSVDALVQEELYSIEQTALNVLVSNLTAKFPELIYAQVINSDGVIVSSNDMDEIFKEYSPPAGGQPVPGAAGWTKFIDEVHGTIQEYRLPVLFRTGEEGRVLDIGRVVMGFSMDMIEEDINDPRSMTAFLLFGVFVAGVSLVYLLVSILVKPIQALTDGVRAIGEGSFDDEIKIDGPEEIGEIARAFNEITTKFRKAQESVVEQERIQKEMQVAQEIQHSLLPGRVPKISGYDIASYYRAAKEVGGDYYDFVNVDEDTLGVVVADVSGKGVPGSLVMTMIRTALRMEARGNYSAAEVMARMNNFVTEDMKKGMFVTIFYVILDSKNRIISYASAGHNPMILYRAESDETFFLNPRGFPVGISLPDDTLFKRSIDVEKIKLKKDDMLVIYTDGVTEAMDADRKQYGDERLIQLIKKQGSLTPQEFIENLSENIKAFTGDQPQNDDITVVAIKEKLMADDVLFGIRKKLLDLVELQGFSVAEACKMMKVSPSTFYRYKKRLSELGERGLKNKLLREEHEIKRVSLEQRKELLEIIGANPSLGAKRIAATFNEGKKDKARLSRSLVYDELKRMRLNTYEKRLEYLRRNRFISEEEFEMMLSAPASRRRAKPGAAPEAAEPAGELGYAGLLQPADAIPAEDAPTAAGEGEPAPASLTGAEVYKFELESEFGGNVEIKSRELAEGTVALHIKGHLDSSSSSELDKIIESFNEYGYGKIIIDLGDVSYISSGGWGIFTSRVKSLREEGGDVVLAGMSSEVYDIYEILGFQEIIMHFHGVDDAFEFISMPLESRQARLDEVSHAKTIYEAARSEQRPVGAGGGTEVSELEEAAWTPLKIEAGTVGDKGEITVLYMSGVIDTVSSIKLRSILDGLVDERKIKLVLDMSGIEYVSSSGWGVFASRIKEVRNSGGDIKIFGMDREVDAIFRLLDFDLIMRSFSILTEAIGDFNNPPPYEVSVPAKYGDVPPGKEAYGESRGAGVKQGISARKLHVGAGESEVKILAVSGAIDASSTEELEQHLDRMLKEATGDLVLDLSEILYISSSGWGIILKYMQLMGERSRSMVLACMNSTIFKIFRDLGFEPLIGSYPTVERAVAMLTSSGEMTESGVVEETDAAGKDNGETRPQKESNGEEALPRIIRADLSELEPLPEERQEDNVVVIDFSKKKDMSENKDDRVRKLGWSEYGKKLFKHHNDDNNREE